MDNTTYKIISPKHLRNTIITLPNQGQYISTPDNKFHFNRKYQVYSNGVIWCNDQSTKFGMVKISTKPVSNQISFLP